MLKKITFDIKEICADDTPKIHTNEKQTGKWWVLKDDKTKRVKHTFRIKATAKKGGVLKGLLGKEGGSVRFESWAAVSRRMASGPIQELKTQVIERLDVSKPVIESDIFR